MDSDSPKKPKGVLREAKSAKKAATKEVHAWERAYEEEHGSKPTNEDKAQVKDIYQHNRDCKDEVELYTEKIRLLMFASDDN